VTYTVFRGSGVGMKGGPTNSSLPDSVLVALEWMDEFPQMRITIRNNATGETLSPEEVRDIASRLPGWSAPSGNINDA
jgi:hypothetical protein